MFEVYFKHCNSGLFKPWGNSHVYDVCSHALNSLIEKRRFSDDGAVIAIHEQDRDVWLVPSTLILP
jgi:hypothetical protein